MPKFPEQPHYSKLQEIDPITKTLRPGTMLTRLFFAGGAHPANWSDFRYFGPTASRFDHHLFDSAGKPYTQNRGIMYLAYGPQSIPTRLAEVFQAARIIDRHSRVPILVGFETVKSLMLLDLRGPFATAIGASMALHAGARPRARRWAQTLYDAYPEIEGLLYCSSMFGGAPAIALFERAQAAIPPRPILHRALSDPALDYVLTETGRTIGYQLI